jgi:hypothetical protein
VRLVDGVVHLNLAQIETLSASAQAAP